MIDITVHGPYDLHGLLDRVVESMGHDMFFDYTRHSVNELFQLCVFITTWAWSRDLAVKAALHKGYGAPKQITQVVG